MMRPLGLEPARLGSIVVALAVAGCGGGATSAHRTLALAKSPYVGIACGVGNSIRSATACDRVGLAVWLKRPARNVSATIAGHPVKLARVASGTQPPAYWDGYLHPAGLRNGALGLPRRGSVHRRPDIWYGVPAVHAQVRITARFADGTSATTRRTVRLQPGYG